MKSANDIISTIFSHSKKFKEIRCFRVLKQFLPKHLQRHIKYFFTKGDRFYIVVNTHAVKSDFEYKKDFIRFLLNKIDQEYHLCSDLKTLKIIISISLDKKTTNHAPFINVSYKERAFGNFEIKTQDKDLIEIFQQIKKTIRS
jgi:hypothetical protein